VKAAADRGGLEAELQRLRTRHARARIDAAAVDGHLSAADAAELLARFEDEDDPRLVHSLRRPGKAVAIEAGDDR
jgi:hypothetical protein